MQKLRNTKKAVIGLYTVGLKAYWSQFEGLHDRLVTYNKFIEEKLSAWCEVKNFGIVDDEYSAANAGKFFAKENVSMIFLHCGTYSTSGAIMPVHSNCNAPCVVLNLQPTAQIDYLKTTTGEWLAHCGACVAPEISNAFNRYGIDFKIVNGLLGMPASSNGAICDENTASRPEAEKAWQTIHEWVQAATIIENLKNARFGFLGSSYSGMLDLYSDFTMLGAQTGIHVEILEMCDFDRCLKQVTQQDIDTKLKEIADMFNMPTTKSADPRVKTPTKEQLEWAAKVAAAEEKLAEEYKLDAISYYYHSSEGNAYEQLQSGMIVGNSLLTAKGIPCAGEADMKTALAMKICDILDLGGSFCEIVVTDYINGTILIGHDGPFHINIADDKPLLRGMGVYHGKKGVGVSVEAKVKKGNITTLNVTQTVDGKIKLIASEGDSVEGQIMQIGNTQTPVKFKTDPDTYMTRWFEEFPTHHCALSVGHNAAVFEKFAHLKGIKCVTL